MDNCGGQSYDGAGNMAGRYSGVLTLIQHQFPKFILLLDKFLLVETSDTNCWIHPCARLVLVHFRTRFWSVPSRLHQAVRHQRLSYELLRLSADLR